MIWEELNSSLIFTDVKAQSYQDVMEQIGGACIKEGYAKESYVDALIEREGEFPTGLDIDGVGVAIPHTDAGHVIKEGIAIGILENPVEFVQMGSDETVKVNLVFMLAIAKPHEHLEKLQKILGIIQDKEVLKKLLNTKDTNKVIEIVKEKEKTL